MNETLAEDVTVETVVPSEPVPVLNAATRCDSGAACGNAQAWTVFRNFKGNDLEFCAHHTVKHMEALVKQGFALILDHRDKINAKPSPSANAG
jgi:hypothetical protein